MSCNSDCLWGHVLLSSRNMGHSTVEYNEVGKRQKRTFGREAVSFWQSSLSSLKVFEAFRNSSRGLERRAVGDGTSIEAGDSWCDVLHTVGIHFLIIPSGQSFSLYSPAIKHPPYGTFGRGHSSAPQQAGISGEPGHLKCADTSFFGTVRGNGTSGLEGLMYAREMSLILFYCNRCSFPCSSSYTVILVIVILVIWRCL